MLRRTRFAVWTAAALVGGWAGATPGATTAQESPDAPVVAPGVALAAPTSEPRAAGGPGLLDETVAADAAAEKALNARLDSVQFDATPAADALQFLAEQARVDLVVDPEIDSDETLQSLAVSLQITRGKVAVRTALELVLEQIGPEVTYTIRDGLVYVTHASDAARVVVYDCRDLLERAPRPAGDAGVPGGLPGGAAPRPPEIFAGNADDLIQVLTSTISPDTWADAAGFGTVTNYRGLLVVKQSAAVHRQIRDLLASLRSAMKPGGRDAADPRTQFDPAQ